MTEGLSMESIDLETPRKFLLSYQEDKLNTPHNSPERMENNLEVTRQLNFENNEEINNQMVTETSNQGNTLTSTQELDEHTDTNVISSTNSQQHDYSFQPDVMSTPSSSTSAHNKQTNNTNDYSNLNADSMALIPIAQTDNNMENNQNKTIIIASSTLNTQLELIAVPVPGQPNCYQLAKVVDNPENLENLSTPVQTTQQSETTTNKNYRCDRFLKLKRDVINEYIDKFKNLQHAQDNRISSTTTDTCTMAETPADTYQGFTQYQYDMMQQQLRIHIQQLTQNFVQTYCHPQLWKLAPKIKELLLDLQQKSKENVNFQVWNLEPAIELIQNWQKELDQDTPENTELMNFLHHENGSTGSRHSSRFHPRILDCYLNSPVFMYPQYLPRLPFSGKPSVQIFSPVESYLIAMGLEKHLKLIYDNKEKISHKTTPLRVACNRLAKDTVYGHVPRRIWDHILYLQKVDYYNPIKYFFENNKAPPVDHDPIWTFHNNVVLPPKDRIPELPEVFQTYLQKKNEQPKEKAAKKKKSRRNSTTPKVSEAFRNSFFEFVQEAVGQDIPDVIYDPVVESSDTPLSDCDTNIAAKRKKLTNSKPAAKRRLPQSLTINVNYVYGNSLDVSSTSTNTTLATLPATALSPHISNKENSTQNLLESSTQAEDTIVSNLNTSSNSLPDSTINSTIDLTQNPECPVITYNFDWRTKTLNPSFDTSISQAETHQPETATNAPSAPAIDYRTTTPSPNVNNTTTASPPAPPADQPTQVSCPLQPAQRFSYKPRTSKKIALTLKLHKKIKQKASAYREKRHIQRRCEELITLYSLNLDRILVKYKDFPLINNYYRRFKALELYTKLLKGLKAICVKASSEMANSAHNSPSSLKRSRSSNSNTEDDNNSSPSSARQVRKLNRQEENFRHMLLPDTPEEANRKDAIYAFNFYEKVEEAFKASNKPEDCKKFNAILKSFDPKKDKVSDLYYKLEKLFLPDHPELAQVFLTFLLPAEAAEIGKFFEHFMINNMTTFINKLNIYFNKQPAQIRKIYNSLNDLAEDPDVTMRKVETKIVPLLKGNQFLIDWFMQQFPQNTPPERLFANPEHINLKDQQTNRSSEYVETVSDLMDSPTNDVQQQQSCQLRYINGRIFYGSKMLLPAKLSFMAATYKDKPVANNEPTPTSSSQTSCVHGIREHGEKRLQAAADLTSTHTNVIEPPSSDDQDKSEEEDVSKALVIDTTADEEDSCSSVELCDEASLRAHANRLNPSVYSSTCYAAANATSTPNLSSTFQAHHPNAKKTSLNFHEEAKLSPRKNSLTNSTSAQTNIMSPLAAAVTNSPINSKDKRKSPSKKKKSPLNNSSSHKALRLAAPAAAAVQPMVVIHETSSAIQCAKRLKTLIGEEAAQQEEISEEPIDSKDIIQIVARTKNSLKSSENVNDTTPLCDSVKKETSEDMEFLAEESALSPSPFPCLRMDTDSNEEDAYNTTPPPRAPPATQPAAPPTAAAAAPASDEECKIDIVTTLTTNTEDASTSAEKPATILPLNAAWTREEDKIILIEMKLGFQNRQELCQRIAEKLPNRTMFEITSRHQFLMDFLSKLQGK